MSCHARRCPTSFLVLVIMAFAGGAAAQEDAPGGLTILNSPTPPSVQTVRADFITNFADARLVGNVNPNGSSTTAFFEYGLTNSYGTTTPSVNVGSGTSWLGFLGFPKDLTCGTTYHFRARASNAGGTGYGADMTFRMLTCPGDFNGDGKADILWRHTSGADYVFFMNGTTVTSGASLPSVDPSWSIVGTADFNGDGQTDILLRHTSGANYVFFMNGTTVSSGASLPSVDTSWTIAATGDFYADGQTDIVWRHSSGATYLWVMNGWNVIGGASLPSVDPSWSIAGTGDFTGNGQIDILWHHTSGAVYLFNMSGTLVISGVSLPAADPSWNIAAVGDFNTDGKPDILWRHTSGAVFAWLMNGTTIASGVSLPSVDPSWKIVGPK